MVIGLGISRDLVRVFVAFMRRDFMISMHPSLMVDQEINIHGTDCNSKKHFHDATQYECSTTQNQIRYSRSYIQARTSEEVPRHVIGRREQVCNRNENGGTQPFLTSQSHHKT